MNQDIRIWLDDIRKNKPIRIGIPGMADHQEILNGFTTRYGGGSTGPYESLNLNFFREDQPANVLQNFKILSAEIGVDLKDMVLSKQVHGTNILRVSASHRGMGITRERTYGPVDGLAVDIPGIMLVTYYADCVPLYFYDPVKRVICLSHSGWKGTLLDMAGKSVRFMADQYGCDPGDICVSLGPHIRACCFEVGDDLAEEFFSTFSWASESASRNKGGKRTLNLERIIIGSLKNHGITGSHIQWCDICTKCEHDIFFSHRGSGGKTGTGAAFLMMRD